MQNNTHYTKNPTPPKGWIQDFFVGGPLEKNGKILKTNGQNLKKNIGKKSLKNWTKRDKILPGGGPPPKSIPASFNLE